MTHIQHVQNDVVTDILATLQDFADDAQDEKETAEAALEEHFGDSTTRMHFREHTVKDRASRIDHTVRDDMSPAWAGAWTLGQGTNGKAYLWVKLDDEGKIRDRIVIKDVYHDHDD